MSIKLVFIGLLLILSNSGFSQLKMVKGKITSADDSQPLVGTNVTVQGTTRGVVADLEGNYSIEVLADDRFLSFSFIGYVTQIIEIGSQTSINVLLQPDVAKLEEVVVIGYGTVRKSDLTGSVSSVRGADLTRVPSINPMQALQGKVAGVQVASFSGAPGSGTFVRVRGIGTFNDSSPIYVVDGVILQNIDYLSSADIESIEVLKDASATAIYGSRGANGVIMVTTKQGKSSGGPPTISVTSEYSLQQVPKQIDLLSGREYAIVRNRINPGTFNNIDAVPNTDWQSLIFRVAPLQTYQVSASGGSDKFQYFASIGYFGQDGIIPKSKYERVTVKLNNVLHLSKNVRFGGNFSFTPFNQQNTAGNAVFNVYRALPTITPRQPDGTFSPVRGVGNVLADIEYTNSISKGLRSVNNVYLEATFLKDFVFKSSFGVDMEYGKATSYTPVYFVDAQQQNPLDDLGKRYSDRVDWLWENTLTYTKTLGGIHRFNGLAGYTIQNSSSEVVSLNAENTLGSDPDLRYVNIFPNFLSNNFASNGVDPNFNFSMLSFLARLNYTLKDRYMFTASFRRDGSSKFPSSSKFANFPSFAFGWNVSNEDFMADGPFSNLKLRASWGKVGNDKIPYSRQYSLVSAGINAVFGNDTQFSGLTYGVSGNPNLIWETTTQSNVGLEMSFLGGRLTAEVDYYNRNTDGILIDLSVPGYFGNGDGAQITFNAAQVLNRGVEIVTGWKGAIKGLRYVVNANATTIHNETLKVSGTGGTDEQLLGVPFDRAVTRTVPGVPIGSFFGYNVIGIFQNSTELTNYPRSSLTEVGDLKFEDVNKDGFISGSDRVNLGSPIPTLMYGLSSTVEYRGFDLAFDFQGQYGNKIYNAKETLRPDPYNFEKRYLNFWNGEGTSNSEPRPSNGGINYEPSSRYIYDGSFVRLRNLSLGYTLPQTLSNRLSLKSVRIYLRATNLFTVSSFPGYAPDIVSNNPILNGIDTGSYPVPRVFSTGLNLTF